MSAPEVHRREVGKVARLPKAVRDQVNLRLVNGETYAAIVDWLTAQGHPGFNEQNVLNWRTGGHQHWLRDQRISEEIRARSEAALDMVRALREDGDGQVHITEANEYLVASHLAEVLAEFDPSNLKTLLRESPKQFVQLANVVIGQSSERTKREKLELEFRKYRDAVEEQKAKILAATARAREGGGLSEEALQEIEERARLL